MSITLCFEWVILYYIYISPRWRTKRTLRICVSVPSRLVTTPSFCVQRCVTSWWSFFEWVILDYPYIYISPRWRTKHTLRICVSVPSRLVTTPSSCVQRCVTSWWSFFEWVILDYSYIYISPRRTKHTLRICVSVPSRLVTTAGFCVQRCVTSWWHTVIQSPSSGKRHVFVPIKFKSVSVQSTCPTETSLCQSPRTCLSNHPTCHRSCLCTASN